MSNTRTAFFTLDENAKNIYNMVVKARSSLDSLRDSSDEKYKFLLEFVGVTLFHIHSFPESFDERCIMNIASLGERFIDEIRESSLRKEKIEHLFTYCHRFVIEYQLSTPHPISDELLSLLARVSDFEYEGRAASQVRYAGHQMLINVVQHYLYHPSLTSLKNLPDVIQRSEVERERAESLIVVRETRVQALAEKLETYETAYNFVGLYAGFKSLKETKVTEKRWNFFFLLILGSLILAPFVVKLLPGFNVVPKSDVDYAGIITLAGLELLLLYFFRVALHNFRSIKAQLLQIELRMTLCQFVQSYAEYAKSARDGSSGLLERFEQVVFSGIVTDENSIPSTFDGFDQIANLFDKLKK